jgi:hypothetical protein
MLQLRIAIVLEYCYNNMLQSIPRERMFNSYVPLEKTMIYAMYIK